MSPRTAKPKPEKPAKKRGSPDRAFKPNKEAQPLGRRLSKRGAPSKRTPEIEAEILKMLSLGGISRSKAAEAAGIHRDTMAEWLKDPTFSDAVAKAMATAALRNAGFMVRAAQKGNVRAAEIIGKGLDPEFYNPPIVINVRTEAIKALEGAGLPHDDAAVEAFLSSTEERLKKRED